MKKDAEHNWRETSRKSGVVQFELDSWEAYFDFIRSKMLNFEQYVYRGDRCDNRPLLPSFDRKFTGQSSTFIEKKMTKHLDAFKASVCGRRGPNPICFTQDKDWWAVGQHNGLDTPLLDWTQSPFVALFFAFEKPSGNDQTPNRCIYAAQASACNTHSKKIISNHTGNNRPDVLEFFRPFQDDNPRLINQNSMFSWGATNKPVGTWIRQQFSSTTKGMLLEIRIPDSGREECLRTLNRMNINHLTLFPDLYGASHYTNLKNIIEKY